jgi:hypothetical protein
MFLRTSSNGLTVHLFLEADCGADSTASARWTEYAANGFAEPMSSRDLQI